jgi:hypothetical protein
VGESNDGARSAHCRGSVDQCAAMCGSGELRLRCAAPRQRTVVLAWRRGAKINSGDRYLWLARRRLGRRASGPWRCRAVARSGGVVGDPEVPRHVTKLEDSATASTGRAGGAR